MSTAIKNSITRIGTAFRHAPERLQGLESVQQVDLAKCMQAYELLPDGVSIHRSGGWTMSVSSRSEQLIGALEPLLLGNGFVEQINVQDRVGVLQSISQAAQGMADCRAQFRVTGPGSNQDGAGDRWLEARCNLFRHDEYPSDDPLVLLITRDVTDERSQSADIEEQIEQVHSANHAKSAFLSAMSHELRTPLNAIMGFSDMLAGNAEIQVSAVKQKEYAGIIGSSAEHLLGVLNRILDISKIEAGKYQLYPEPFNLADLTRACLELMQPVALEAGVYLKMELPDGLPIITADKGAIRQVLINLLANGVKFSEPGNEVTIQAVRAGNKIKLCVRDSGIGMDEETIVRLGEKFYQADNGLSRQHQGTGLGLSIVFGLVKLHNGTVQVESEAGEGTTVTMNLPLVSANATPVPADPDCDIVYIHKVADEEEIGQLSLARKMV